ncbi:MAG: hypothetical protein NTZ35_04275 [Ignavibacteriales bacterium]|nr:hypothetical protein [Ignavibacteriales bacterium]
MKKTVLILLFAVAMAFSQPRTNSLVNFAHLQHLTQEIVLNGGRVSIVHVYANYPGYEWVEAGDSGEEGIACVDDAARAAVVYLRSYELQHDTSSLTAARSLLRFVMSMQADDGKFYNFVRRDYSVNCDGKTSVKSFGWWAGRAVWAISLGFRLLKDVDAQFASDLNRCIQRSLPHVEQLVARNSQTRETASFQIPTWLLYESGSDATTELMLGLIEFSRATNDEHVKTYIQKLADGLMVMQDGDIRTFPFGAHRSWETMWHSWGNSQSHVLAYVGRVLGDKKMIASAEKEAKGFYTRLLMDGMLKEWNFAEPQKKSVYEQIAYGIRPMTLGLLRLYDATGNKVYLKMAGLAASWLFGNNVLHESMYDSTTGRCFDGISDSTRLNRNSGAESTIEALYTLLEIEQYPLAKKYLNYKKKTNRSTKETMAATFQNDEGDLLVLTLNLKHGTVLAREQ